MNVGKETLLSSQNFPQRRVPIVLTLKGWKGKLYTPFVCEGTTPTEQVGVSELLT